MDSREQGVVPHCVRSCTIIWCVGVALAGESIRTFLDETFGRKPLLDYLYAKLRYESLLYEHCRKSIGIPEPLRLVRSATESRYADPLTVESLARAARWSVAHLRSRFRLFSGTTPRQMILKVRLLSVREQLVGSGYSIKGIAATAGYARSSEFYNAFRKEMGMTPKAYRERYYFD